MFGKKVLCPLIEGLPLTLAPISKADLPLFVKWVNEQPISRYLGSHHGYTIDMEEEWYETAKTTEGRFSWGIFWGDRLIGNTDLHKIKPFDHSADYGVMIGDPKCWGKGIGTAVAKAVAAYGFQTLNLDYIYASVFASNKGSQIALERAGYTSYSEKPGARFIEGMYETEWMDYLSREHWLKQK